MRPSRQPPSQSPPHSPRREWFPEPRRFRGIGGGLFPPTGLRWYRVPRADPGGKRDSWKGSGGVGVGEVSKSRLGRTSSYYRVVVRGQCWDEG